MVFFPLSVTNFYFLSVYTRTGKHLFSGLIYENHIMQTDIRSAFFRVPCRVARRAAFLFKAASFVKTRGSITTNKLGVKMKRSLLTVGSAIAVIVALSGCSSVDWENVGYVSPANEVNLKAKPSIKIIAVGNKKMMAPIVKRIENEFANSEREQFKRKNISKDQEEKQYVLVSENPDYWIVLSGEHKFRADDRNAIPFNRKVGKTSSENENGGKEFIQTVDHNSSTATALLSIAVYGVNDLSPVYYSDVALYDADFKSDKVRSAAEYNTAFEEQIIAKIKDAFLIQKRNIETALPKNADRYMKQALLAGKAEEVITRAKDIIPQDFDSFMDDIAAGKYKEKVDEMEIMLSDYYILALAKEIHNFEPGNLRKLHAQHVAILEQTTEEGLIIACPNSLARIESKLRLLQALK